MYPRYCVSSQSMHPTFRSSSAAHGISTLTGVNSSMNFIQVRSTGPESSRVCCRGTSLITSVPAVSHQRMILWLTGTRPQGTPTLASATPSWMSARTVCMPPESTNRFVHRPAGTGTVATTVSGWLRRNTAASSCMMMRSLIAAGTKPTG